MYIEIRKNKQDAIWCYPDKRKKKDMHHEMKRQIRLNSWRTHIKTGFWFHEHLNMANEQVNVSQGFDVIWTWFWLYQYQEIISFIRFYSLGTEFLMKIFSIPAWWSDKCHPKRLLIRELHKRTSFSQENKNESEDPYETYNGVSVYRDAKSTSAARRRPYCS